MKLYFIQTIIIYSTNSYNIKKRKGNSNMEMDYKALGKRIKIARIKKGITQESIANEIDITPSHLSNVETGKTKVSLPTLIDIANALSINIDSLLCDNILNSKVVFEGEAKEVFDDCDEYEIRMLVDILKYMKETIRKDRKTRDQFSR